MGAPAPFLTEVSMATKKQQEKEQLRTRLQASERNKRSAATEKAQRKAGRITVSMLGKARKEARAKLETTDDPAERRRIQDKISQMTAQFKTQGYLNKFLGEERARKVKEGLALEKKRQSGKLN